MNAPSRTINFHGIGKPGSDIGASESRYWIDTEFFTEIVEELAGTNSSNQIYITFDDGNLSDFEIAAPLLFQHKLHARFFVLTGRLDSPGYLGRDELAEMQKMGFLIGSHGQNHVDWTALSAKDLERETKQSRETLEEVLNAEVREAAIPFGDYNRTVLSALKDAGYRVAWTSDGGDMNPNEFLRPRTSVRNDMNLRSVQSALFGSISPARRLRRALAIARKRYL